MTLRRRPVAFLVALAAVVACAQDPPSRTRPGAGGGGGAGGAAGAGGGGGAPFPTGGTGGAGGGGSPDASAPSPDVQGGDATPAGDQSPAASDDCARSPTSLLCDPLRKMPRTIKETGLFPAAPDFTQRSSRLRHYAPDPALWSDGMEKERFLLLPAGKKIDATNPRSWVFPVGTIFIKTFFDDSGPGGKPRAIETRFIRRVGTETDFTEYDYYLYQWKQDGTDADLVIDDRNGDDQFAPTVKVVINHQVNGAPLVINRGQAFDHTLPSRAMCGECHQENGVAFQTFIGFDEIRLNTKLTAAAAKTQLQEFQDADLFTTRPAPGAPAARTIQETDPLLLKVKRFVFANCVHCHHEKGKVFDLSPDVFVKNTVNQMTNAQSVRPPMNWLRVYPGMPEMSVVFVQARRAPLPMPTRVGDNRLRPMPPIGVNDIAPDPDGVASLRTWIMGLRR
jgi:hypothetical protein